MILLPAFYYYNHFRYHSNGQEAHLSLTELELGVADINFLRKSIIIVLKIDFKEFFLFIATHKDSVAFEVFLYLFVYFGLDFSKSSGISNLHSLRLSRLFLCHLIVDQLLLKSWLVFHPHYSNSNSCPFLFQIFNQI